MYISGKRTLSLLLLLLLAGCATHSRLNRGPVPDWASDDAPPVDAPPPLILGEDPLNRARPSSSAPAPAPTPSPAPPAPSLSPQAPAWVPLARWCQANTLPAPSRLSSSGPAPAIALTTPAGGAFVLRIGSRLARWEGAEIWLGFAPQWIDNRPFVHSLDLQKTLQPLLCASAPPTPSPSSAQPTIVIDPGHGGEDSGTRSILAGRYEKDFTLDWARRLAPLLATHGWRVLLTRTTDTTLAPSNRVAFAEQQQADLFLSLHFNSAAPDHEQAGLETYCLTPAGMPSSVTRGYDDDPALAFANNAFDTQNLRLALRVHHALLQVNGNHDRGIRRARFPAVLRGEHRPAILIEGGYLSNPREARLIADPAYRQKLADALARALLDAMAAPAAGPVLIASAHAAPSSASQAVSPSAALSQTNSLP